MGVEIDKIIEYCKKIVNSLIESNFQYLEECCAFDRVTKDDIIRVVKGCGGKLSSIPNTAYETNAVQVYKYNNDSGYKVDIDLWFDGKRSDLTLQLDFEVDKCGEIESFTISDILVM